MACYLGNTVTRATVDNAQLAALLGPELREAIVRAALADAGITVIAVRAYGPTIQVDLVGGQTITVDNSLQVRVSGYGGVSVIADRVSAALKAGGDARFAALVAETLREVTGLAVTSRQAAVQGQAGVAYVLTAEG